MAALISLIAAVGEHLELGAKNDLLWHLPDDFRWFVNKTKGHTVVMGRKTMESLGKPLKNRRNIAITSNPTAMLEEFDLAPSLDMALNMARESEAEEIFIIGGGQIYKQSMEIADRLYITRVHGVFPDADTWFPAIGNDWQVVQSTPHGVDEKHAFAFEFLTFERNK